MMTQFLLVGDLHFKTSDIERCQIMCKDVISKANETNPDFIVILGDVYHDFEQIKQSVNRRVTDFFEEMRKIAPLYVLVGNHDRPNNTEFCTKNHSLAPFEYWDNIHIIDTTKQYNIKGYKFVFVPYVYPGRFEEALDLVEDWRDSDAIFAHQEIKGVKMDMIRSEMGDEWQIDYPQLFCGHIHEYQKLASNIHYPGNVMQLNYGDNTDKSISLITFKGKKWTEKRLYTDVPCKVKLVVNVDEFLDMEDPEYDVVKITIKDTEANIKTLSKNKKMKDYIKRGFIINIMYINNDKKEDDDEEEEDDMELIERRVEDYDKLLYSKVNECEKSIKEEFKQLFPEIVEKYQS